MPDRRAVPLRLPHVALSSFAHDRHGLQRTDDAWLERAWRASGTRVLALWGSRLPLRDGAPQWLSVGELPAPAASARRILLGERDGVSWFAAVMDPREVGDDELARLEDQWPGVEWQSLRSALAVVAEGDATPLVMHAVGMAEWHASTRFCPRCGRRLTPGQAGHVLLCAEEGGCGRSQFPRTDPAVIMLVTDGEPGADDERCLLGRNVAWPEGRYSTLAGFVEPGETFEDAVRREVMEETGVGVGEVTYFGNQPWPLPASMMVGFTARAASTAIDVDGAEIEHARWLTRAEIAEGISSGELLLPGGVSISHSLIETWFGARLDSTW